MLPLAQRTKDSIMSPLCQSEITAFLAVEQYERTKRFINRKTLYL